VPDTSLNPFAIMRTTTGTVLLYALSLGVAAYGLASYGVMPIGSFVHPDMKVAFMAHPLGIYVHVFAAAVALLLGPFQFSAQLRNTHLRLHRWMGRAYLGVGVLVGGLSGLYISQFAFGGPPAKLGFATLALCWLYTGLRAFLAIRRRAIAEHRKWMVRNFALAFAAVMLRLYLPASAVAGLDFAVAYPAIAWLCWVPNLVIAERLFNHARDNKVA
jgi:uncharacterized membrane protein